MFRVVTVWANQRYNGDMVHNETEKNFEVFREADKYLANACRIFNLIDWELYENENLISCAYSAGSEGYQKQVSEYFNNKKNTGTK